MFDVEYEAVIEKLGEGEVCHALVTKVNESGMFVSVGLWEDIHISQNTMDNFSYDKDADAFREENGNEGPIKQGSGIIIKIKKVMYGMTCPRCFASYIELIPN